MTVLSFVILLGVAGGCGELGQAFEGENGLDFRK
jgi:hypothetical protein